MHDCVSERSILGPNVIGETARFFHWFGQSKIVNQDGTPKVVYHGTFADFDSFRPKKRTPNFGFHFGSISQAEFFAGCYAPGCTSSRGYVMPVFLRIEKPLRMPDICEPGDGGRTNIADWLLKNGIIDKRKHEKHYSVRSARDANELLIVTIEASGYDGIMYANEHEGGTAATNEDSYIVFHSEQIKSVFNRGTFDPLRACILE